MRRAEKVVLFSGLVATASASARPAHAYNWLTHRQLVFEAVEVMRSGLTPPPPAGVSTQEWTEYLGAVQHAPARLEQMTTGLPNNTAVDFTGAASPTSAFPSQAFPYDATTDLAANKSRLCAVHASEPRNLDLVGSMPIKNLEGYDVRRNASPCGLEPRLRPGPQPGQQIPDPSVTLPAVLGWHAGSVDDHAGDSVFWSRPTHAGFWGPAVEAASRTAAIAGGALVAPFKCLYDLFSSGSCDLQGGYDLGKKYNPVDYATGWIPGVGSRSDGTTSTVWHFQHVDGPNARFNETRGLFYEHAGPTFPSPVDLAILVGSDLAGVSINPWESQGIALYGSLDEVTRGKVVWGAHTIGHTEFSPLDKMALRGWLQFAADGRSKATGLAWPLHAIGDAAAPHHVAGTTGWGHRAYENFVEHNYADLLATGDVAKQQRILIAGFRWWKELQDSNSDISAFVKSVARETRTRSDDHNAAFYQEAREEDTAHYGSAETRALVIPMVEHASAATLGMLAHVAIRVVEPSNIPDFKCASGTSYAPVVGCVPTPPTAPPSPAVSVVPISSACGAGAGGCSGAGGGGGSAGGAGASGAGGAGCSVAACGSDSDCVLAGAGNRCTGACCEFFVP